MVSCPQPQGCNCHPGADCTANVEDGCEKSHFPDKVHITAGAMDVTEEHNKKREKKEKQRWRNRVSLSASLPDDVCGVFAGSACLVKYSTDPIFDMRESILEMIRYEGVCDWNDMEELVYCYVALNPPEVHEIVREAFLSLCSN
ncbi:hypothetical protein CerSpe_098980 [Prunus speciosa]